MKKYNIIVVSILLLSFYNFSCNKDFLTKLPQGALSEDVLSNQKGIEGVLIGAYAALEGGNTGYNAWYSSPDNWVYGSVVGGDAHKGSEGGDQPPLNSIINYSPSATNEYFEGKWRALYEGVSRSNRVLGLLAKATDISDADKKNFEGQARFLRGYFYFELKKMWNMVPWIDENTTDVNQPNTNDIWPQIEADLKFAYENLPNTQSSKGKVNKWAAGAFLGKAYLFQHKFPDAKKIFDDVISNGVTSNGIKYDLNKDFEDNWRPEKEMTSPEAIFSIEEAANVGTNSISHSRAGDILNYPYPNSPWCCGFFQPTQDLVNSYRTNPSTGLPYLDSYNSVPVKSDMGISSNDPFSPDNTTLDPRLDWTVGRRGIPYKDWGNHPGRTWIRDQTYGGPYSQAKFLFWQSTKDQFFDGSSWGPGSAINFVLMRFSQVLLMAAECEIEQNNFGKAEEYVNRVRNRMTDPQFWVHTYVNNSDPMGGFTSTSAANYFIKPYPQDYFNQVGKDAALKAIYFESKLELALEGHRFFDLVRWGIAESSINSYVDYESQITLDLTGGKFVKGKNEYFPIPQMEIDLGEVNGQPTMIQNPGY